MALSITLSDIRKIEKILGVKCKRTLSNWRFEIGRDSRKLALEIYPNIAIGKKKGHLVSVYTHSSHLQLHFCTGYVVSALMGEITFVGEHQGRLCGLTIEREGGCSLYANVDRGLLSGDFTNLGPEVMLSGIALSLTEMVLNDTQKVSKQLKAVKSGARIVKKRKGTNSF